MYNEVKTITKHRLSSLISIMKKKFYLK